jgi:phosphohistidine phosphatase
MILYFLRHGLAWERETWTGDDALRPLTKKGENSLAAIAETLFGLGLGLDLILASPYVRAYQTAVIVAKRMQKMDVLVQDSRLAPGFGLAELAEILKDHKDANCIMLVGHEPDFSQTVSGLIGGGNLVFKKAGLARVDLSSHAPPEGELIWLIPPKVLVRE